MGNLQIHNATEEVRKKDFEGTQSIKDTYFSQKAFQNLDSGDINSFLSVIKANQLKMQDNYIEEGTSGCFPVHAQIDFKKRLEDSELWSQRAQELWTTGFASWKHTLNQLQPENTSSQVVLAQGRESAQYEYSVLMRSMIACAAFMLRHQGGDASEDLLTFSKKYFSSSYKLQYGFETMASPTFLSLFVTLGDRLLEDPASLKAAVEQLLATLRPIQAGSLFSYSQESFALDLQLKYVRELVVSVVRDERTSAELRQLCVQLLLAIGQAAASAEDLLLAASFQYQYKIDISQQINYFCEQTEVFEPPASLQDAQTAEFSFEKVERIQSKVDYEQSNNRQQPYDKMACDGTNYFTFAKSRGLTRGTKGSNGSYTWVKTNDSHKELEGATLLVHKDQLYVRHKEAKDQPFVLFNKSELTKLEGAPNITEPEDETPRFKWTAEDDAPITNDDGRRWMGVSPMASDGRYIYAMVEYRESNASSERKAMYVEVYDLKENVVSMVREFKLLQQDGQSWVGPQDGSDGGYLNHGFLVCNGQHLIWFENTTYHLFDVKTGKRVQEQSFVSGKHLTMFDPMESLFYCCDADCYSWLDQYKMNGFKMMAVIDDDEEDDDAELPAIPVVLDKVKADFKAAIRKPKHSIHQLNLIERIVGGQLHLDTCKTALQSAAEQENAEDEEDKPGLELEGEPLHENTLAIILALMSKEAQVSNFKARAQLNVRLDGEQMLKFFKRDWGVQISQSMFEVMRCTLEAVLEGYNSEEASLARQFTLKAMLHLYIAHLACVQQVNISIKQIMTPEEICKQQELIEKVGRITLLPGQNKNPGEDAELSERECFALHIFHLKNQAINEMEGLISTQTTEEKLDCLLAEMDAVLDDKSGENLARMLKRYAVKDFTELLDQDEAVLKKMQKAMKLGSQLIQSKLTDKFQRMLNDSNEIEDEYAGYGSDECKALHEFLYNLLTELIVAHANQVYAIVLNQPDAEQEKDSDAARQKERALDAATKRKDVLGDVLYNGAIDIAKQTKELLCRLSQEIQTADYEGVQEDNVCCIYAKFDSILTGKNSLLRLWQTFVLSTNCYEVETTYLDELSEAFFQVSQGLRSIRAGMDAARSLNPELEQEESTSLSAEFGEIHRLICFAQSRVALRLLASPAKALKPEVSKQLSKQQILAGGVKTSFIPLLSESTKQELEGSFKMTNDESLMALTEPSCQVEYTDGEQAVRRIADSADSSLFAAALKLSTEEVHESTRDILRKVLAATVAVINIDGVIAELDQAIDTNDHIAREDAAAVAKFIQDEDEAQYFAVINRIVLAVNAWIVKTKKTIEARVEKAKIEEFKQEYAQKNVSNPDLPLLNDEQMQIVQSRCAEQVSADVTAAIETAKAKADLVLLIDFSPEDSTANAAIAQVVLEGRDQHWKKWEEPTSIFEQQRAADSKAADTKLESLLDLVLNSPCTSEELKLYIEENMIRGLRRLAGLEVVRRLIAEAYDSTCVSDALQVLQASLYGGKARISNYLYQVGGCGKYASEQIRQKFFDVIQLICRRLEMERDPKNIVHMVTCLIWDYKAVDMSELCKLNILKALTGSEIEDPMHPLVLCWGKEANFFSVSQIDVNVSYQQQQYSLSARVRQTFVFIAQLVLNFCNGPDSAETKSVGKLKNLLMQQLNDELFFHLDVHLSLLALDEAQAARLRDQEIRFDNESGEKPDPEDAYNAKTAKLIEEAGGNSKMMKQQKKQEKKKTQKVSRFMRKCLRDGLNPDYRAKAEFRKLMDGADDQMLLNAVVSNDWRLFISISSQSTALLGLGDVVEPQSECEEKELDKPLDSYDRVTGEAGSGDAKILAVLQHIRSVDASNVSDNPTAFYSRVTVLRLIRLVYQQVTIAQRCSKTWQQLKNTLKPDNLRTLVLLTLQGTPQIQIIVHRIIQCLIKMQFPITCFDEVIKDNKQRFPVLASVLDCPFTPILQVQSPFWQIMLNQVQAVRTAQLSSTRQVEKGKVAVAEEIIRSFDLRQFLMADVSKESIFYAPIEELLKKVDTLTEVELATVFSLIRESNQPVLTTGKLCRDRDGDLFIVLGHKLTDLSNRNYESQLYLTQQADSDIVGLTVTGSDTHQIKLYKPMNVNPVADIQLQAKNAEDLSRVMRTAGERSLLINPDVIVRLVRTLTSKEMQARAKAGSAVPMQHLALYVQRGIFSMLSTFGKDYLQILKSFSLLEGLFQFLGETASAEVVKPDELLISTKMLDCVASEQLDKAASNPTSVNSVQQVLVYLEAEKKQFFVQLLGDDTTSTQIREFDIKMCVGEPRSDDSGPQPDDEDEQPKQKASEEALQLTVYSPSLFRLSESEALLVPSKQLNTLNGHVLYALRLANTVIVDDELHLEPILQKFYAKLENDRGLKESMELRFIVVSAATFAQIQQFMVSAPPAKHKLNSRGSSLCAIFQGIKLLENKLTSPQFITKFLSERQMPILEFLGSPAENILRDAVQDDYEDSKEREEAQETIIKNFHLIKEGRDDAIEVQKSIAMQTQSAVGSKAGVKQAPDFSLQFTTENGLISEAGKDFFLPQTTEDQEVSNYHKLFDSLVYQPQLDSQGVRKLIWGNLLKLNQGYARAIWMRLMASAKDAVDNETRNLINSAAMHVRVCDLLHDTNMAVSHQAIFFGDPTAMNAVRKQIELVMAYYDGIAEGSGFCNYFVKDLLKRSNLTIEQVKKDHYQDLPLYNLKDLRKVSKLHKVLDPNNLLFFSKILFKMQNYLTSQQRADMAKAMFDLHLGFAILFKAEVDTKICNQLVEGCSWALDMVIDNIRKFVKNSDAVQSLLDSSLLFPLYKEYLPQATETTDKMRLLNEVTVRMKKIHEKVSQLLPETAPLPACFKSEERIANVLGSYEALSSGGKFKTLIKEIRLQALIRNEEVAEAAKGLGESFSTDYQMFLTNFKRTIETDSSTSRKIQIDSLTCPVFIRVANETTGKSLLFDSKAFQQSNENVVALPPNSKAIIEFPIYPNKMLMSGQIRFRGNSDDNINKEDWSELEGLDEYSVAKVTARHEAVLFLTTDETFVGVGFRAQGREGEMHKLRKLEKPDNCVNIKKIDHGKFFRLALTESGQLFFQGQAKKYILTKEVEVNDHVNAFIEVKDLWNIAPGDKIVDMAGGKHFMIVVTEKGKIFGTGWNFYRQISEIRHNEENNEDMPYELCFPEGWHVRKVWAADTYNNIWVLAQKRDDLDVWQTFSAGSDYDMVGASDGEGAPRWRNPKLPENTWFVQIASQGHTAFGIDNHDHFWEWAQHVVQQGSGDSQAWESFTGETRRSSAYRFKWFERNNLKPIDVRPGYNTCILRCQDTETGQQKMFGIGENQNDGKFGAESKEILPNIYQLSNKIEPTDVVDYACTKIGTFIVTMSQLEPMPSLIEDEPEYEGLVHFFKRGDEWTFIKEEEIDRRLADLPSLMFATRTPIKNFKELDAENMLPNLELIESQTLQGKPIPFNQKVSEGEIVVWNERLYVAKTRINGKEKTFFSTLDQLRKGNLWCEMQPLIWYSIQNARTELDSLPLMEPEGFHYRTEKPGMQARISILNEEISDEDIKCLGDFPELEEELQAVLDCTPRQDDLILRAVDMQRQRFFGGCSAKDLMPFQFAVSNFEVRKCSALFEITNERVENRMELLFKYSKAVANLSNDVYFAENQTPDSLGEIIHKNKGFILPSVRRQIFESRVLAHLKSLGQRTPTAEVQINRRTTYDFFEAGIKHNPAFVTDSHFGNLTQQCHSSNSDFLFMANIDCNSFNCSYDYVDKDDEHAAGLQSNPFTYRLVERELQSDILPLLVRTPNGQMQKGLLRDCWVPNPNDLDPAHQKFYQFIGCFIAHCMIREVLSFKVRFAPTFWKLTFDEESQHPTLADFAREDVRLAERLARLDQAEMTGEWPDNEQWAYTDASGVAHQLPNRPMMGMVSDENYVEFKTALLGFLIARTEPQMRAVRLGMKTIFGQMDYMRRFLDWVDVKELCMGEVNRDFEKLKAKTKVSGGSQEYTERFWKALQRLNAEYKRAFLNFVWGRTTLPEAPWGHEFEFELTVDAKESLTEDSLPSADASNFKLVVPNTYKTDEKMREKLMEAIDAAIGPNEMNVK